MLGCNSHISEQGSFSENLTVSVLHGVYVSICSYQPGMRYNRSATVT
jgi:hypothetical protein